MAVWCVYIGQTQENRVSAIIRAFFDSTNCVELQSYERQLDKSFTLSGMRKSVFPSPIKFTTRQNGCMFF